VSIVTARSIRTADTSLNRNDTFHLANNLAAVSRIQVEMMWDDHHDVLEEGT
jgi:hypothetical protein